MLNKTIIVLQNTTYHFETGLSLYSSLANAGADVYMHRCCRNIFKQEKFLENLNVKIASDEDLKRADCGVVVSAYPNPQVLISESVPNEKDESILGFGEKLLYVAHRFMNKEDYESDESPIKIHNSVCLSPLGGGVGLDYLFPVDMPVVPIKNPLGDLMKFSVQSHFHLRNRNISEWINSFCNMSPRAIRVNFIGNNVHYAHQMLSRDRNNKKFFSKINEELFYHLMNCETHFIMPLIDGLTKGGAYIKERFSSNFNLAFALEKPVFCHEVFREIYGTPGFYYDDENVLEVAEKMFSMTEDDYGSMVDQYKLIKEEKRNHNKKVLTYKISNLC